MPARRILRAEAAAVRAMAQSRRRAERRLHDCTSKDGRSAHRFRFAPALWKPEPSTHGSTRSITLPQGSPRIGQEVLSDDLMPHRDSRGVGTRCCPDCAHRSPASHRFTRLGRHSTALRTCPLPSMPSDSCDDCCLIAKQAMVGLLEVQVGPLVNVRQKLHRSMDATSARQSK